MPKGVEHVRVKRDAALPTEGVKGHLMPKGVEHKSDEVWEFASVKVKGHLMPKGVEHNSR